YHYAGNSPVKLVDPDGKDIAIFLDREGANTLGHVAVAIFHMSEDGNLDGITYFSFQPEDGGKPKMLTFQNKEAFYDFLSKSKYGDMRPNTPEHKRGSGAGYNYDDVIAIKTTPEQDELMLGKIDELYGMIGKTGKEYAMFSRNCKHAASLVLKQGGIKAPKDMFPINWFTTLKGMKHDRNVDLQNEIQQVLNSTNEHIKK
ncbi:MAG: hypothetical protein WBK20_03570, partial [Spirochaetota bacterium]